MFSNRNTFHQLSEQPCLVVFWKLKTVFEIEIKHPPSLCIPHLQWLSASPHGKLYVCHKYTASVHLSEPWCEKGSAQDFDRHKSQEPFALHNFQKGPSS